ncbi:MAG: hypothetical protein ACM30G_04330 [Micromonosporaceae bacterium]
MSDQADRIDATQVHEHVEDGPCLCADCSREAMLAGYHSGETEPEDTGKQVPE